MVVVLGFLVQIWGEVVLERTYQETMTSTLYKPAGWAYSGTGLSPSSP
jgi:hypothetical protein